ncbi:MAG: hypothetical protein ACOCRO_01550 [Halanaerobiales bacterium]
MVKISLLEELKVCMEALEALKDYYLSQIISDYKDNNKISEINAGQYIAYARCYSVLLELIEKHKVVES